jgi:glucokinase
MTSLLGVDVGGTKIAVAPVDPTGGVLAEPLIALSQTAGVDAFLAGLEEVLRRALAEFGAHAPVGIGIACAGTVDAGRSEVVLSPNLPLVHVPLGPMLRDKLRMPVVLENDANAALLGEVVVGAAAGATDVVMLTLGTGVGGGLFMGGRLHRGANGGAGELGHVIVQKGGIPCHCGSRGCLEMYASGSALVRYAAARAADPKWDPNGALRALQERDQLHGRAVTELAHQGHRGALDAVRELGGWLGVGLVSLTNAFDPEMIVVGGGVSALGELLLEPARALVRATAMPPGREKVEILTAELGNEAGLVGAALSAWEHVSGKRLGAVRQAARRGPAPAKPEADASD